MTNDLFRIVDVSNNQNEIFILQSHENDDLARNELRFELKVYFFSMFFRSSRTF
jgi:hypothetical protein